METFEFQTETKQLLDLMINSIYSNKDIFLRELISNSSDALDKIHFQSLTDEGLADDVADLHIMIEVDPGKRTLSVIDNGIGMSRDEIVEYIGTIAKSGTREYLEALKNSKDGSLSPELIGQFGVGLYSAFMVADQITIITRKVGEEKAVRWCSSGDGTYTIEVVDRDGYGTTVELKLKDPDSEDGLFDYTDKNKLQEIIKRYSDFVAYPIRMELESLEVERNDDGTIKEGGETKKVLKIETVNSQKAIWTRPPEEVKDREYKQFYTHISHDWSEPLHRMSFKAEGTLEFRALLFFPRAAPYDLYMREFRQGIQLYVRRVFIMADCKELIPEYLRFVRGVVDSEDLSLNISREILQKNRQIAVIRKHVTRKILDEFKKLKKDDDEKFRRLWEQFAPCIKEGLYADPKNRDKIFDVALFWSTENDERPVYLTDYVDRMPEEQKAIYYMTGPTREAIENSPHLEAYRAKGYEVLYMTEAVDEIWLDTAGSYKDIPFVSVGKGDVELGSEEEREKSKKELEEKEEKYKKLLDFLKSELHDFVKEVRLSNRLTESPVCLVGEKEDISPQMERLLKTMGQNLPKIKRILEINPDHPVLGKLHERVEASPKDDDIKDYAKLLYGQALMAEGSMPEDPSALSKTIADLMTKAL